MPRKEKATPKKPAKPRLSPKQLQAIHLLAEGKRQVHVAELIDASISTVRSWQSMPHFRAALDDRIAEVNEEAVRELRTLKTQAVGTIRRLLADPDTPANVALQAALKVLEVPTPMGKARDQADLNEETLKAIRERIYGIFDTPKTQARDRTPALPG